MLLRKASRPNLLLATISLWQNINGNRFKTTFRITDNIPQPLSRGESNLLKRQIKTDAKFPNKGDLGLCWGKLINFFPILIVIHNQSNQSPKLHFKTRQFSLRSCASLCSHSSNLLYSNMK